MKRLILIIFACICILNMEAKEKTNKFTVGEFEYQVLDDVQKTVKVSKCVPDESSKENYLLEFPNEVTFGDVTYAVKEIGELNLFYKTWEYLNTIYYIIIPDNVEVIADNAFRTDCYDPKYLNVTIGKSIQEIGHCAFGQVNGTFNILSQNVPKVYDDTFQWYFFSIHSRGGFPDIIVPKEMLDKYMESDDWKTYAGNIFATDSFNFADTFSVEYLLKTSQKTNSEQYSKIRFVNITDAKIVSVECVNETPLIADINVSYPEKSDECNVTIKSFDTIGLAKFAIIVTMNDGNVYSRLYEINITKEGSGIDSILDGNNNDITIYTTIYTLDGVRLEATIDSLPSGVYIIRQNGETKRIVK